MEQKLKVIVFDFDNTLYVGDVWGDYYDYSVSMLSKILPKDKAKEIADESKSNNYNYINNDHIIATLKKYNYDYVTFVKNLIKNTYIHTGKAEVISDEFLKELKNKYHIYIATMSNENYLNHYIEKYKINKDYFKGIYSADLLAEDNSKVPLFKKIIEKEKVMPEEVLMVGDSYMHDILPAQLLGMQTLYFNGTSFDQIYNYFTENKILDCTNLVKI